MGYGNFRTGVLDGTKPTPDKLPGAINGGQRRVYLERFDLSKANVDKVSGTNNIVADIPDNQALIGINVSSTVSLGTSTLSFGTAANATLYSAATAYGTTPDAVIQYLRASLRGVLLTARTRIIMTSGTANLPSSGTIVVEIVTAARG